jgi:lipopolysaccharide export system protein LptA
MHKLIILILLSLQLLRAEQVEVNALEFEADENKMVSYFKGDVSIKKGSDYITADKLRIDFDKKNKPSKYDATGGVSFSITTDNQHFEGTSSQIIYEPSNKRYTAIGNVRINETTKNQKLRGELITIDRISGKSKLKGSKNRPVKFIFTVDE